MAARIRLTRCGRRNHSYYRIGVYDSRTRRNGRSIETLGTYDPHEKDADKKVVLDDERAKYWISVGAQPTDKVGVILKKRGLI